MTEALSIAAAAVQFVDFSTKLIKCAQTIYESGVDHTPDSLDAQAFIQNLNSALDVMRKQGPQEPVFQGLISRCSVQAKDIQKMIPPPGNISTSKLGRGFQSFKMASRHLWYKKDFEDKIQRLSQLKQVLRDQFNAEVFKYVMTFSKAQ
jgi:hypothetical protein